MYAAVSTHVNDGKALPGAFSSAAMSSGLGHAGWRGGIAGWSITVSLVLVTNIVLAIYVGIRFGYSDGLGTLYEGDCDRITAYNTGAHVLINVLGILFLSGSNYSMQCLTAPSRREMDAAHQRGRTLEIGISSFRNLFHVAKWKVCMWILFAVSSLPLHLLYNTVVYGSLSANSYVVFAVNEAFVNTPDLNVTAALVPAGLSPLTDDDSSVTSIATALRDLAQAGQLDRLDNQDCINAYATTFLSARRNLFLVVDGPAASNNATVYHYNYDDANFVDLENGCAPDPVAWMCAEQQCNSPCLNRINKQDPATWAPFSQQVQYCLSQPVNEQCQLQLSLPLAIVVIFFNSIKLVLMVAMLLSKQESRMHTIGDAIQSYLREPEAMTENACLKSTMDFQSGGFTSSLSGKPWKPARTKFSAASGKYRWRLSFFFYSLSIAVCIGLLGYGLHATTGEPGSAQMLSLGLGTVTAETYIYSRLPSSGIQGFMVNVILANLPQLILSCAYFTYNGLFTSMLAAYEWSQWAWKTRALRVSQDPLGAQKSTYFLQLPYRYAVPLLAMSGAMHWLVSQSLFMVTVTRFSASGQPKGDTLCYNSADSCSYEPTRYSCGWSPIGVVCVIVGGVLMMVVAMAIGWGFHLKPGMPLGGTNSAVIAAACHPDPTERQEVAMEYSALKWGVVHDGSVSRPVPLGMSSDQKAFGIKAKPAVRISALPFPTPLSPVSFPPDDISYHAVPQQLEISDQMAHCAFSTGNPGFPLKGMLYR